LFFRKFKILDSVAGLVHQLDFSVQCILTEGAWLLGGASAIWLWYDWYGMVESRWIVSLFVVFRPNRPENDPGCTFQGVIMALRSLPNLNHRFGVLEKVIPT
jgi:hypothetical protein